MKYTHHSFQLLNCSKLMNQAMGLISEVVCLNQKLKYNCDSLAQSVKVLVFLDTEVKCHSGALAQ